MRDWLSHRARTSPDATALVRAVTGEAWDFTELDGMVDEMAGRLVALGVAPGDHVGVVLQPRVEYVTLIHAAMRLGVTLVPLGDRLTARELAEQIETADVTVLVCGAETEARAVEATDDVPLLSVESTTTTEVVSLTSVLPDPIPPASWSLADVQLLLFTSGTTGEPKAVKLTMGNLLASATASMFRLGFDPDDRWLVTLSLHHMGGIAPVLRMPLYGMTVVLRDEFDAGAAADDIDRYDVTAVSLVPTMLRRMLDSRGTLASSLRTVLLGGAPAPRELVERCRDYSIPVYPTYGMTETSSQVATARPDEAFDHVGTVGRPLFWTDVTVVNEDGDRLPPGETGEFVVSGPTVSPGYYNNPEATAAAFDERGLHTGDVGYVDEGGRLYVLNRVDDRIVTGGENVDPGEVADVLRSHPDVHDVAVVGIPDAEWGECVSALVVSDTDELDRSGLRDFAREQLAGFKIPRVIAFADELPRTVSGTVEREAVREQLIERREAVAGDTDESDEREAGDVGDAGSVSGEDDAGEKEAEDDEKVNDEKVDETDAEGDLGTNTEARADGTQSSSNTDN
ncbi:o-succinylbenzoate-CoA ligase [Halogeometricum borinquense DSM 11551]|uniref:2-succinylbenzoate--CoA ligase n=1 Tax=Halogeometricum borinquense (strain ATCC 700274 / DSM 11551 / JCM 10706 / KCTC 4070 / PR3) TaxID=469382 RepID=E4NN92_HALBP|nr:o-succinylbenzoate--CoA ligase [Halogeometricum borinquense]ADQ67430.1 O-succinylbenzoate-CoA ligase [Halogeometricum borinquense DSM 11551]ELY23295.1 o-succinylbenzoate-CoA ligase [Halogeometricum borinquense DSM 11551]